MVLIFQRARGLWEIEIPHLKDAHRASLVAQWLRVHLPMQGTQVRAPVREDPTCCAQSGWAREPWLLSLRVRNLYSARGEVTAVRGPCTAKKKRTWVAMEDLV